MYFYKKSRQRCAIAREHVCVCALTHRVAFVCRARLVWNVRHKMQLTRIYIGSTAHNCLDIFYIWFQRNEVKLLFDSIGVLCGSLILVARRNPMKCMWHHTLYSRIKCIYKRDAAVLWQDHPGVHADCVCVCVHTFEHRAWLQLSSHGTATAAPFIDSRTHNICAENMDVFRAQRATYPTWPGAHGAKYIPIQLGVNDCTERFMLAL